MSELSQPAPALAGVGDLRRTVPPWSLFLCFLTMGLRGFGGVMPWVRRALVEEKGWLTEQEFVEALSLCQFLPGPNVGNVSIYVGSRLGGAAGAFAAIVGLMLAPCAIVIGLGALYDAYGQLPVVRSAIGGVAAAAAGLICAMGVKMARPLVRRPPGALFIALAFVAVGPLQWNLPATLLVLAPASVAVAAILQRRGR
jgi:chromate transporter